MTEEMIKKITEAEEKAAQCKREAEEKSANLLSETEAQISRAEKSLEETLRAYKETQIKDAKVKAQERFEGALKQAQQEAKAYSANVLKNAEIQVNAIVGRQISGDR